MEITQQILDEVQRATRKFPTWPTDPLHALAVLGEEFGELTKEVVQLTYEPHKSRMSEVRKEAIQTAAMALRFAASLDDYHFTPGRQHQQFWPGTPETEQKAPSRGVVSVTKWNHPSASQALVLEGTPESTRTIAEQHFEGEEHLLTFEVIAMDRAEFEALREFEG